jgi:hypothetical protein
MAQAPPTPPPQEEEKELRKIHLARWDVFTRSVKYAWLPLFLFLAALWACWLLWNSEQRGMLFVCLCIAGGTLLWFILALVWARLEHRSKEWVLTTQRVVRTAGVFSRRTTYLELYRVEDLWVESRFPLSWLGCGSVILLCNDKTDPQMRIGPVSAPTELVEAMRPHIEACRARAQVHEVEVS